MRIGHGSGKEREVLGCEETDFESSGGLYYASAVLAPPGWGPLAAWLTGWSNWLGQVTGAPVGQFLK